MTIFDLTERQVLFFDGEPYQYVSEKISNEHQVRRFEHQTRGTKKIISHDKTIVRCAGGWKIRPEK